MNEINGLVIRGNIIEEPRASLNDGFQSCRRIKKYFLFFISLFIGIKRLISSEENQHLRIGLH